MDICATSKSGSIDSVKVQHGLGFKGFVARQGVRVRPKTFTLAATVLIAVAKVI